MMDGVESAESHIGPPSPTQERKVVTTLICDLVGFTAMSEAADPEDMDALLRRYGTLARQIIESHGGAVEKFIGDAVMAVFGVPAVHEDDSERAVRAGLRIIEEVGGLRVPGDKPVQVRIGINTGEALVRLDVTPGSGEGLLTGDAVNVAARLQAAAPPMGVVVGGLTHALTARAFEYEELPAITAKGKVEPVAVWLARSAISRFGIDVDHAQLTPLVGREFELAFLKALLERAVSSASPQFAVLLGEPGIGKSRLVQELFADVGARPEMITWRQGHCLPYGEDVTFWALGEIVKAHAGILEGDGREAVEAKLDAIVPRGEDREWLRNRLRALLGLEAPTASRDENFAAWLRFVEEIAGSSPTVLVFEDLHWADEALLAFVEYLATHAAGVPLLVVATARPELLEKHSTFAAGSTHVNRLSVDPLTRGETQQLVAGLLSDADALSDTVADIVASCGGNPFFAEQTARLVVDQVRGAPVPASVQAVLAARLDALPAWQKALLGDAAVIGSVFWDGALLELGHRDQAEVDVALQDLIGKHLVRRVRRSSMLGEHEYAFAHALAREVAYAELPRAQRARKHAAVAAWLEAKAGSRIDDLAETLARHYTTALDMARAGGLTDLAESLVEQAIHCLRVAGARAVNLDVAAAERYLGRALELAEDDSPERQLLLVEWAHSLHLKTRHREAADVLQGVLAAAQERGDIRLAGKAAGRLMGVGAILHDRSISDLAVRAKQLLETDEPSPEKAEVLVGWASYLALCGDDLHEAIRAEEEAIAMCMLLGLPEPAAALGWVATARSELGDAGALVDFQRAIEVAEAQGLGVDLTRLYDYYGFSVRGFRGPQAAVEVHNTGLEIARRRGIQGSVMALSVDLVTDRAFSGEWDEALSAAAELAPQLQEAEDVFNLLALRPVQTLLLLRRGEVDQVAHILEWMTVRGRRSEVGFLKGSSLLVASAAYLALGSADMTLELLAEWAAMPQPQSQEARELMPEAIRSALVAGDTQRSRPT